MSHVLVIDDDSAVQMLFEQVLTEAGYSVSLAANGQEGMRQVYEQKPDLVVSDIMMPDMDGLELLMELRSENPELPVIVISGGMRSGAYSFLPHAKKMGASLTFEKPVDMEVLLKGISDLLDPSAPE